MKDKKTIIVEMLFGTTVTISIIALLLNNKAEDRNYDTDRTSFIKEENDNTNPALPTVSPDLENQINEIFKDKDSVKPRLETINPYYSTLEYEIKRTIGCGVDELEFTDIPADRPFVYEGLEFTITDFSIITGKEFIDQFFDDEDKNIPESELSDDYDFTKDGIYAIIYYSLKKITDEATYITDEMLFTDMKLYGVSDWNLTGMVRKDLGKAGRRRLTDIPVGEQVDSAVVLNLTNPSDSDEFYILIPKVSGNYEISKVIDGKITQEEASLKYKKNKAKFYRIKLIKD